MEISVNFKNSLLTISKKKNLKRPSDKVLWPMITCFQSQSALFLENTDFPICPKAACRISVDQIQLWAVAVSKLSSQTKLEIMSINIRPVIIEIIAPLSDRGFSQRDMSIITRVPQDAISKTPTPCSEGQQFYLGRGADFSQGPGSGCGADQADCTMCLCRHCPKMFSSIWISLKTSRQVPQTNSLSPST